MIKLSYEDTQYLMSYVQPDPDCKYQVRLLCIFTNGFLTSDGFYKEVWAENRPTRELTKPTVFNTCSALDLPIDFREHKATLSKCRSDLIKFINEGKQPEDDRINYIAMDTAMLYAQDVTAVCPENTTDIYNYNVFNYEYSWCILWP